MARLNLPITLQHHPVVLDEQSRPPRGGARRPPHRARPARRPATGSVSPRRPRSGRSSQGVMLSRRTGGCARTVPLSLSDAQYLDPRSETCAGTSGWLARPHGDGVLVEQPAEGLGEYEGVSRGADREFDQRRVGDGASTSLISAIWASGSSGPRTIRVAPHLRAGRRAAPRCQGAATSPWRESRTAGKRPGAAAGTGTRAWSPGRPLDIVKSHQDGTRGRELLQPGEHCTNRGRRVRRGVDRAEQRCQRRRPAELIGDRRDQGKAPLPGWGPGRASTRMIGPSHSGIRPRAATSPSGVKIKEHPNGGVVTPVRSTRVRRMRGDEDGTGRQRGRGGSAWGSDPPIPARRAA